MVKAILTKPLDGMPEGTPREFDQTDFDALKAMGAVRAAGDVDEKKAPVLLTKAESAKRGDKPATKAD